MLDSSHRQDSETKNRSGAVVVASCDAYSDLWAPFFHLFWKYWPDCPYRVYLTSNTKVFDHSRVTTLLSGGASSWSDELRSCLDRIEEAELIVMLEDFFLRAPVDNQALLATVKNWREAGGLALRLHPRPAPDRPAAATNWFGECSPGAPYRVSLQATVWTRAALTALLRAGESAWEFEVRGSERSAAIEGGFYCCYQSLLPYKTHVVEKGKWYRDAARTFQKLDIGCDFSKRPLMSRSTFIQIKWTRAWGALMDVVSWRARQRWRTAIHRYPLVESLLRSALYLRPAPSPQCGDRVSRLPESK